MKPKTFKVMEGLVSSRGSHVRFRGLWLVGCGFAPGVMFSVSCPQQGTIVLQVTVPPPPQTPIKSTINRLSVQ